MSHELTTADAALEVVIDLPFLASEVNDAHRQITYHAKGMLLEAKRAGDALLAAKAKVKHGEFEGWVIANCRCSYRQARKYMQVSKMAPQGQFEGGINAFLEANAKPRVAPPKATLSFTEKDADRLLNIAARVERGEGAEKVVAASKLAEVAQAHGTTPEALLERSRAMCPDREKTVYQAEADEEEAEEEEEDRQKLEEAEAKLAGLQAQIEAFQKREALIHKLLDLSKEELAAQLADALIRLGE